jgi:Rrf2 family protein
LHPLSQSAGYAILALSCLDDPGGEPIMVQDVAQWIGAPGPYLSKVFHALGKARLVDTKRGRRGGVILVRPAKEITLEQIADAMDGDEWRTSCLLGLTTCSDERACPVHAFWTTERTRIYNELQGTTLADVARFERSHRLAHPATEPAPQAAE